jgi:hypothetical protein
MLPLISFETGRRTHTQSSGQQIAAPSKWKSGSIHEIETAAVRPTPALSRKRIYTPRSSRARRESFLPLDKDLSWKSAYRTCSYYTGRSLWSEGSVALHHHSSLHLFRRHFLFERRNGPHVPERVSDAPLAGTEEHVSHRHDLLCPGVNRTLE